MAESSWHAQFQTLALWYCNGRIPDRTSWSVGQPSAVGRPVILTLRLFQSCKSRGPSGFSISPSLSLHSSTTTTWFVKDTCSGACLKVAFQCPSPTAPVFA